MRKRAVMVGGYPALLIIVAGGLHIFTGYM